MRESVLVLRKCRSFKAAAMAAALTAGAASAAGAQDFTWEGRAAPGQSVEIKGVNGDVKAGPAAGGRVEVTAVKKGRRSDPASVEVRVVEHAGGVTVCAVYPTPASQSPNECRPGEGGRMSVQDNDVSVSFTVRVPRGVRFVGRSVNGGIEADGLAGDVEAHTVNGGVRVSTGGTVQAETVNGSITASAGRDAREALSFKTVNGSIALDLPAGANASLQAATVNGEIVSEFPLHGKTRVSRRQLSGTIGAGGQPLTLETVNGSIRIRQRAR